MIYTDIGALDGDRWEGLIQSVFKRNYDTYQEVVASPGDFGIEGFVLDEGILIQCYCPDREYDTKTLYEKQREKITRDLGKLKKYEKHISKLLGNSKIKQWLFITPCIAKHDLIAHARVKEEEIRAENISFLDEDCRILVKDLEHYRADILQLKIISGKKLSFSNPTGELITSPELTTDYDGNIAEKNQIRSIVRNEYDADCHNRLNNLTKKRYIQGYAILRNIHRNSPEIYERISKIVNRFEDDVEEQSSTWEGSPQKLLETIQDKLLIRFEKDPYVSKIEYEDLDSIANHMISRWIAECPMRIVQ